MPAGFSSAETLVTRAAAAVQAAQLPADIFIICHRVILFFHIFIWKKNLLYDDLS
jgi:hypothetical protein